MPAGHEKSIARVTIHDAGSMTKRSRKMIAAWLRRHAAMLEKDGGNYAARFTGRHLTHG